MNSFIWVSRRTFLGGAHYSAVATLPVAKNQLVSDIHGQLSGGGGFADSYYLPLILGWNKERASIRALAGFLAPTGRFTEGASDNVGSGYWTPTLSSGQTVQLTRNNTVTFSAFELYEWHTTQQGSGIGTDAVVGRPAAPRSRAFSRLPQGTGTKPGDTINLDYSLLRTFAFAKGPTRLQVGLAGYEQRQTTAKTGPAVSEEQSRERYAINALGFVTNLVFPNHRFNAGIKFFEEFGNRASYQGYSFQVSGAFSF